MKNRLTLFAASVLLTGCVTNRADVRDITATPTAATVATPEPDASCSFGHVSVHLYTDTVVDAVHIDLYNYTPRAVLESPEGLRLAFCAARAVHDALMAPDIHAALEDVDPATGPTVTVEGQRIVLSGFERIDNNAGVLILDQTYPNARTLSDGLAAAFAQIDGHAHPHAHDRFHLPDTHSLPGPHDHPHIHDDGIPYDHDHQTQADTTQRRTA